MNDLTLELDDKAQKTMQELMTHYNVSTRSDIVLKALGLLKVASYIQKTNGEIIARKGNHETKLLIS